MCFEEDLIHLLCGKLFLYNFFGYCLPWALNKYLEAKVDNIMTKIAEYSLIVQTFANFLLF